MGEASERDAFDAQALEAGRDPYFNDVAHFLARQSLGDGRLDGDFALLDVGLVGADDGVGGAGVVAEIGDFDLREQAHGVGGEPVGVEYSCVFQHLLLEADAAQQASLLALGGMILEILAEAALGACFGNGFPDAWQLDTLQLM